MLTQMLPSQLSTAAFESSVILAFAPQAQPTLSRRGASCDGWVRMGSPFATTAASLSLMFATNGFVTFSKENAGASSSVASDEKRSRARAARKGELDL